MQQKPLLVGTWRGTYFYDDPEMVSHAPAGVDFELHLTQTRWQRFWGRFRGHVNDISYPGVPGEGDIRGRCSGRKVMFTKLLPEFHLTCDEGMMSIQDFRAAHDYPWQRPEAHPPIYYDGTAAEDGSIVGTWLLKAATLRLDAQGSKISCPRTTGTFQMRKV